MSLSRESLELFSQLLAQVQIPASADDVVEQAHKVKKARTEISEAWAEADLPEESK